MFKLKFIPREEKYFDLFNELAEHIHESAKLLLELFNDLEKTGTHVQEIRNLEHQCDELTHAIVKKLNKTFVTPIDREDVYSLAVKLDDVIDSIDSVANKALVFRITRVTAASRQQAEVLVRATAEIANAVKKIKTNTSVQQYLIEIHRLENEGDRIHREAIAELFQNHGDPLEVIKWKDVYETLERGLDKCEDVANVLESIVLKHA